MNKELILDDFNDELNSNEQSFYYKEIALKTHGFKEALFEQFKLLPTLPKYSLYIKDVLNYASIVKSYHEYEYSENPLKISKNTTANSVQMGSAEIELNAIINDFKKLSVNRKLDTKHYGRDLLSTPLIQTLIAIDTCIKEFEKYVSKDITKDSYQTFGQAFANKLILLTDKLSFPTIKEAIIMGFINENENLDITVSNIMNEYRYYNTSDLKSDYNILKLHADNELIKHLKVCDISKNINSHIEQKGGLTLWSLFKSEETADRVKLKLIAANYVKINDDKTMSFICSGKQIKSEPASLYQALEFLTYIETIELSHSKTVEMLTNTFKGFICNEQAIAKGFRHNNVKLFRAICQTD